MTDSTYLVECLVRNPENCADGVLVNELLREFQRGLPARELRALLCADDERLVKTGIWIASELGKRSAALVETVAALLRHPAPYVRYYAIDCLLTATTGSDKKEIAAVVTMLEDNDAVVRWGAMKFMSRASIEQLKGAYSHLERTAGSSEHTRALRWLLGVSAGDSQKVVEMLQDPDPILRKFAVIAATRLSAVRREPLLAACNSDDGEVSAFARDMLRRSSPG